MNAGEELRGIIANESVLFREDGFVLASGKTSHYYYDLKRTTLSNPHALSLAAGLLLDRINALPDHVDAVGGLTSGADPLVVACLSWPGGRADGCPASSCVRSRRPTVRSE